MIAGYSSNATASKNIGFYYMSNAAGRLLGTLLSGLTYQLGGLPACLGTAAAMVGLSALAAARLEARNTVREVS